MSSGAHGSATHNGRNAYFQLIVFNRTYIYMHDIALSRVTDEVGTLKPLACPALPISKLFNFIPWFASHHCTIQTCGCHLRLGIWIVCFNLCTKVM